jgi:hypothetical protein
MIDENKLSDEDVRPLWAKHYSKRLDDVKSKALCMILCLMVQYKAGRNAPEGEFCWND